VKISHRKPLGIILLLYLTGFSLVGGFCNLLYLPVNTGEGLPTQGLLPTTLHPPTETRDPTQTATSTAAPTDTLTPTITPSPSSTATPTATKTLPPPVTSSPTASPTPELPEGSGCLPQSTGRQTGKVTRVIDGDTIEVQLEDGAIQRVRYIGIDTPGRDEPFFYEAGAANRELVADKTVLLVKDVSELDQYERLLRYVLVEDIFVNYELARQGLADVVTYPPDVACTDIFLQAVQSAREAQAGIWGPVPEPPQGISPPVRGSEQSNCDPSYPTVCIPPYPPDLDCKDIPYRRFQVDPPDPHNFDGDFDGLGCEG
jgi:micrococcal nuclease